jgi:hypothetical protein
VFHKRAKCEARCSALPARALHKDPFGPAVPFGEVWERAPGVSRATRRKVGCGVHAETGWLQKLPITQFKLTGCRQAAEVACYPVLSAPIGNLLPRYRNGDFPSMGDARGLRYPIGIAGRRGCKTASL